MTLYKYVNRVQQMDQLIRFGCTGPAIEFAEKLDLSTSQLKEHLRDMRDLGAPVAYCRLRRSYYYTRTGSFQVQFKSHALEKQSA